MNSTLILQRQNRRQYFDVEIFLRIFLRIFRSTWIFRRQNQRQYVNVKIFLCFSMLFQHQNFDAISTSNRKCPLGKDLKMVRWSTHQFLTTLSTLEDLVSIGCSLWPMPLFPCNTPHGKWTFVLLSECNIWIQPLKQNESSLSVWRVTSEQVYTAQGNSLWIQNLIELVLHWCYAKAGRMFLLWSSQEASPIQ